MPALPIFGTADLAPAFLAEDPAGFCETSGLRCGIERVPGEIVGKHALEFGFARGIDEDLSPALLYGHFHDRNALIVKNKPIKPDIRVQNDAHSRILL